MPPSRIILSNHTTHAPTLTDPFDERIDYNSFAAYYPMVDINAHPDRFLHCLRALSRSPRFVRGMRKGLKEARRRLSYSSPAPGDRGSTLTRGGAGSAGAQERARGRGGRGDGHAALRSEKEHGRRWLDRCPPLVLTPFPPSRLLGALLRVWVRGRQG